MPLDRAKSAVERFLLKERVETPTVAFFGGEPLLNFDMIQELVHYYGVQFKYRITTNGTILTDEILDLFKTYNFQAIVSLDGTKEIHDKDRCNSFDKVLDNIKKMKGIVSCIRATFTPENLQLLDRTRFLHELLDTQYTKSISIEPVFDRLDWDFDVLKEEYDKVKVFIVERLLEKRPVSFHNIMVFYDRIKHGKFSFSECGAGRGTVTVTPDETVYACHRLGKTKIGDLYNTLETKNWIDTHVTSNNTCLDCDYFTICGGHCRFQGLMANGSLEIPDEIGCKFKKLWIDIAKDILKVVK